MNSVETTYKFAPTHEWIMDNGDGTVSVGVSEHAQSLLGDVVFVELPEEGDTTVAGQHFSLVESVKAASDIYAPVSGVIVAVNDALDDNPEIINESPFEAGWIVKIELANPQEIDALMDYDAYNSGLQE